MISVANHDKVHLKRHPTRAINVTASESNL